MAIEHFEKQKNLESSLTDFVLETADFDSITKKIVAFCVIQLFVEKESVCEIIKFDSAHGVCHVHKFYREKNQKELLLNKNNSTETFRWCRKEIRENWQKYKKWFLEKQNRQEERLLT